MCVVVYWAAYAWAQSVFCVGYAQPMERVNLILAYAMIAGRTFIDEA